MPKVRQSNMELLRIVCMMFILVHHVLTGALPLSDYALLTSGTELLLTKILDAFCFVAVNVFVLISGYFSIQPSIRGFLRLYVMCAFYVFLTYHVHLYLIGDFHLGKSALLYVLFPFGRNPGWWFLGCYVILYFLSPLINRYIDRITKKEFLSSLILLTVVNLYFGFYRCSEFCNTEGFPTGYTVLQFVYMYFIGRYLRLHTPSFSQYRWWLLLLYGVCSILVGTIDYSNVAGILPTSQWFAIDGYNHPLVMASSIALFMFFITLSFQSRIVNYIAQSCLPLYLVHGSCYIVGEVYKYLANMYNENTPPIFAHCSFAQSSLHIRYA